MRWFESFSYLSPCKSVTFYRISNSNLHDSALPTLIRMYGGLSSNWQMFLFAVLKRPLQNSLSTSPPPPLSPRSPLPFLLSRFPFRRSREPSNPEDLGTRLYLP